MGELDPAAPDVRVIRRDELDRGVWGNRGARLRHHLPVDAHLAGENQCAGALA
jgi:hypothetical protein